LDPNGAHAIEFGKLCKCGAELCHPDEVKMGKCYPCSAKDKIDPWDFGRSDIEKFVVPLALLFVVASLIT